MSNEDDSVSFKLQRVNSEDTENTEEEEDIFADWFPKPKPKAAVDEGPIADATNSDLPPDSEDDETVCQQIEEIFNSIPDPDSDALLDEPAAIALYKATTLAAEVMSKKRKGLSASQLDVLDDVPSQWIQPLPTAQMWLRREASVARILKRAKTSRCKGLAMTTLAAKIMSKKCKGLSASQLFVLDDVPSQWKKDNPTAQM